jgi:hypothetical protein
MSTPQRKREYNLRGAELELLAANDTRFSSFWTECGLRPNPFPASDNAPPAEAEAAPAALNTRAVGE